MSTIEEKRVFGERGGDTTVHLATETGVVRVSVAADRIGTFGLERRCVARDLAVIDGTLAVATDEDVLFGDEPTGFGPALAVGGTDAPIAADSEGRIARYDGDEWTDLGTAEDVRAIDGDLIATPNGVHRAGPTLQHVGLDGVNDVSTPGVPLAATAERLYRLGNGWMEELEGAFELVATDRRSPPGSSTGRVRSRATGCSSTRPPPTARAATGPGDRSTSPRRRQRSRSPIRCSSPPRTDGCSLTPATAGARRRSDSAA
ncbi:HVO_0234 family beta-propeller protein [Halalkalicoccus salilacus]|uniref:HVO_0234 family beta-propeller protein n=1 Tax=Halalkalicoccus sp. GCM10025704 TaxID=3252662 RepID=UPI0036158106